MMLFSPISAARAIIKKHEGLALKVYTDTTGNPTIGYGRNLKGRGITEAEAEHLLANDIVYYTKALADAYPWYSRLDDVRKIALLDMAFNLGMDGLAQFKNMLNAIKQKNWTQAAIEALDSKWHEQVGKRAETIANMLQTGDLPEC